MSSTQIGPKAADPRPVVVVGEFDGFHLGHRQLVHAASRLAEREHRPVVAAVLVDRSARWLLNSVEDRCWALLASGASQAAAVAIDSPDERHVDRALVDEIIGHLDPHMVVMACLPPDGGLGRYPLLRPMFARHGIDVVEVERWHDPDGEVITSSRVRAALASGDLARAADWLGRPFTLSGTVVHGSALGRTIGFPTANLELHPDLLVPMSGVYAAHVQLDDGDEHRAAVNIGVRPTVEQDGRTVVEAHLLDFDGDLYGMRIHVSFRRWLRNERRFNGLDELIAQLAVDVEQTRLIIRV